MNELADGIYTAVTEEAYRALPYVNASSIKAGRTSMQHMKLAMSGYSESSAAKELGTITHAMLLEPAKLDKLVVMPEFGDLRTKAGKEAKAAWTAGLAPGSLPVDVEVYQAAQGMVESCRRHQTMRDLLAADGSNELVIVWTDADTGIRCKARVDRLIHHHLILDVKTARAAGSFAFTRAVTAYGYHLQAAWYRRAVASTTGELLPFVFAVLESSAPYSCCLYELDDATMTQADTINSQILRQWAACTAKGEYTSIQQDGQVQLLELPGWAFDGAADVAGI